jgi:phage shock protein A
MEENIRRAKEGVLDAITSEKQLARDLETNRRQAAEWLHKAEAALRADDEALARAALARKQEHDAIVRDLEAAWEAARHTSESLKSQLRTLENKLDAVRRKRTTLAARQRAAEARQQMHGTLEHFQKGLDGQEKFGRMEDRVQEIEARTDAMTDLSSEASDLEREFDKLKTDSEVESELAALKKKLQGDQDV